MTFDTPSADGIVVFNHFGMNGVIDVPVCSRSVSLKQSLGAGFLIMCSNATA